MEKRLARYAQFYSRIGFVHEFRPLAPAQVRELLSGGWNPSGIELAPLDDEAVTAVIRITGGNFRLMDRLLSQTERIVQINELKVATRQAVEAARESLVIGQSGRIWAIRPCTKNARFWHEQRRGFQVARIVAFFVPKLVRKSKFQNCTPALTSGTIAPCQE